MHVKIFTRLLFTVLNPYGGALFYQCFENLYVKFYNVDISRFTTGLHCSLYLQSNKYSVSGFNKVLFNFATFIFFGSVNSFKRTRQDRAIR